MKSESGSRARRMSLGAGFSLASITIVAVPLSWFQFGNGVEWAFSIGNTRHPLNFGGNPSEVLSHLLNWVVMFGGVSAVCLVAIGTLVTAGGDIATVRFNRAMLLVLWLTVIGALCWAAALDSSSGEGTVLPGFVLLFGPSILLLGLLFGRLIQCPMARHQKVMLIVLVWQASLIMQLLYERSETGGPHGLAFPLLAVLVGGLGVTVLIIRRKVSSHENRLHPNTTPT